MNAAPARPSGLARSRRGLRAILLAAALLLASGPAHAQVLISILFGDELNSGKVEFGLDGGLNWARLDGIDSAERLMSWNLGFYFDIDIAPAWMLHTGVIVKSTLGTENVPIYATGDPNLDAAFTGGRVTTRLQYFDVPILAKYKVQKQLYVEGGPMLGLLHGATDEFGHSVQGDDDLSYTVKTRDAYHPIDAGVMVGVGWRLLGGQGVNLGARYYHGLVDVRMDDSTPDQFNRSLYVAVGIPIGAVKDTSGD